MSIATQELDPLLAQGIRIHGETGSVNFSRNRLVAGVGAVLVSVAIAAGCGNDEPDIGGGDGPQTEAVITSDTQTSPPACDQAVETCYTYEQMQQLYDDLIPVVGGFYDETYTALPRPSFLYVESGATQDTYCGPVDSSAYQYCPGDQQIVLGQDEMWKYYESTGGGDAGMALGLAHEWGHHVQTIAGVPSAQSDRETIPRENQADCIAGAWAGWADTKGYFSEGDIDELDNALESIAAAEGDVRSHGLLAERIEATQLGINQGLVACSAFFTQYPLITYGE